MLNLKIALVEAVSKLVHVYSRVYLPRVGIATMGAVLNDLGYQCDLWIKRMTDEEEKKLFEYDIVGIGSLSNTIEEAYRLADVLKNKNITVIMGGPHVTFMPEEALEHCDYVVLGEGDETLPKIIKAIENKESVDHIKGVAFKGPNGEIKNTGRADPVDYKSLPSPDFCLSPQVTPDDIPPIITTSRGCPHNCSFCSVTTVFGRKYRFKSNEQVISELRPIQHRSVCFADDNFCANPVRTKDLLRDIIKADAIPLRWAGQMCVNAASDPELLDLLQETRCRIAYVGVESVNSETLKKFGKAHRVDAIKKCIDNLHSHHIGIHGMFVIDSSDKPEVVTEIVDYAIENDIDTIQIASLTPFPGTKAYEENEKNVLHKNWDKYDGMHVVVNQKGCSPYDMQMKILGEMKRFYNIKRVLKSYAKNRGWRVKYRLGGYIILRKWIKENSQYFENLRSDTWTAQQHLQN